MIGAFLFHKQGAVADYGSNSYKKELMTANKAINDEFQSNAKQPVEKQVAAAEIFSKHLGQFNDVDAVAKAPEINE